MGANKNMGSDSTNLKPTKNKSFLKSDSSRENTACQKTVHREISYQRSWLQVS